MRCINHAGLMLLLGWLTMVTGCQSQRPAGGLWPDRPGPKVLVSFPPLYSFAASVAGDDATVKCFLTTSGPHSHGDPTADQIELARHSDFFVINGLGLDEGVADKLKRRATNPNWKVLEVCERLDKKLLLEGEHHHDHGDAHGHDAHEHEHGTDPHVWLDPRLGKAIAGLIRDDLKQRDSAHAAGYDNRFATYGAALDRLREDGLKLFKDKKQKKFVSFHDSLRYFADSFGLEIAAAIEVDPGVEPSSAKMKEIIEACQKERITVIAVEPQFPANTSARAIRDALWQKGLEAQFVEIDPIETAEPDDLRPDFYERKMRLNLEALAKALK